MSFLAGLPSEFETAKSQILSSSEIYHPFNKMSLLLKEEKMIQEEDLL